LLLLQELEKVKNFDWEEWRKRYLKFNNNKKSRVQDFFRKLDEDGDGYCPRDEFIDGILKARIETKISSFIENVFAESDNSRHCAFNEQVSGIKHFSLFSSVSDPDSIKSVDPDPDPGGQKLPTKVDKK
jgi:hypothetical protein